MSKDEFVPVMSVKARKVFDQNGINQSVDLLSFFDQRIKSLSYQLTQNVTKNVLETVISGCKQLYSLTFNKFSSVSEIENKIYDVRLSLSKSKTNSSRKSDAKKDSEAIEYVKYLEDELKTANAVLNYRNQISEIKLKAEQLLREFTAPKSVGDNKPFYNANNSYTVKATSTGRPTPTARKFTERNCIIKVKIPNIIGTAFSSKYWYMLKTIQDQNNVYITVNNNVSNTSSIETTGVYADDVDADYSLITIKGASESEAAAGQNSLNELMKSMVIKKVPDINSTECEEVFTNIKNMAGPKIGCLVNLKGTLHVVGKKDVVQRTLEKIEKLLSEKDVHTWKIDVFSDDKFWDLAIQSKQFRRFNCKYSSGTITVTSSSAVYKSLKEEVDLIESSECRKYVDIERYQANKMLNNGAEMIKYFQKKGATCFVGPDRLNMIVFGTNDAVQNCLNHVESLKKNSVMIGISSLKIPISPEQSKLIIGKGGANIKRLIEESGVETIQVERSEFPSVSISGTKEAVETCKALILEMTAVSNPISEKPLDQVKTTPRFSPIGPKMDLPDIGPDSFPSLTDTVNVSALPTVRGSWVKPIKASD